MNGSHPSALRFLWAHILLGAHQCWFVWTRVPKLSGNDCFREEGNR